MFIVPLTRPSARLAYSVGRLFDNDVERFLNQAAAVESTRTPTLDLTETDASYTAQLDLPGVAKEDVQVSIDGRRVTVQAQAKPSEDKRDGDRLVHRERAMPSYARSFKLPVEVDQAASGAKLENGVLTLTLVKRSASVAAQITVN